MSNKTSPHGGFITVGTVSHGTLRPQDLLRAFAAEVERISPFNAIDIVAAGRSCAEALDADDVSDADRAEANTTLDELQDRLNDYAAREGRGLYFGTTEGDGSDFGFWELPADELCD